MNKRERQTSKSLYKGIFAKESFISEIVSTTAYKSKMVFFALTIINYYLWLDCIMPKKYVDLNRKKWMFMKYIMIDQHVHMCSLTHYNTELVILCSLVEKYDNQ